MNVSTLHKLCEVSDLGSWKAMYARPFWLIRNNERYVAATNGRALLLTKGVDAMVPYLEPDCSQLVTPFFEMPIGGERISAACIKAWAEPGVWDEIVLCRSCGGQGLIADRETADAPHSCADCDGKGKVRRMPGRRGAVREVWINRNSVACVLESIPPEEEVLVQPISVGEPFGPLVVFTGTTWRVWMMGLMGAAQGPQLFPLPATCRAEVQR